MISGRLLKVALSRPPIRDPTWAASCSVAVLMRLESTTMAKQEAENRAISFFRGGTKLIKKDMGMKTASQLMPGLRKSFMFTSQWDLMNKKFQVTLL